MPISRRSLLAAVPAVGLLTVACPWPAHADSAGDLPTVLANTVDLLVGTEQSNASPAVATKLASMDATARTRLAAMDAAGPDEVFADVPLGTDDALLARTATWLLDVAKATRLRGSGSDLVDDTATQDRVLDAVAWLHATHLADQDRGYYGNWFNWEIGIPSALTRTLVLLAHRLPARPGLLDDLVATMDAYLRNGEDGDVDLDSRFHTGANLADITTNRILQGALTGDVQRVGAALGNQLTVYATIDPYALQHGVTDGHYADGSFIQHHSVAYTGSYGKALLARVVQTIAVLQGTSWATGAELVQVVQHWVRDGFAPVVFEGWMMEAVKGRAVSRTTTGYTDVAAVVEAVVDLAELSTGAEAAALRSWVKFLSTAAGSAINPASFASPLSTARHAEVLADPEVVPADLVPATSHSTFAAMERDVHRRPGWAFALSRSSERISKYEYMNGENLLPWFQGDGAHHLYLSGEDQNRTFGVDHLVTVDPAQLPGVVAPVEQRRSVPDLYGTSWYEAPDHPLGFTSSSESQNTYVYFPVATSAHSGGARLGGYGSAAMVLSDDVAHRDAGRGLLPEDLRTWAAARATRSWFMLDEEVVLLAAGVSDPAGRDVLTTLDRRSTVSADVEVVGRLRDGGRWTGPGRADLAWVRWSDRSTGAAVGQVLLQTPEVDVRCAPVRASRRVVRLSNPATTATRTVYGVEVRTPAGSEQSLAWALVPGADEAALDGYAAQTLRVLANTTAVQAVEHAGTGLTGVNTFGSGRHRAGGVEVEGPAAVLVRRSGSQVEVAVAEPTTSRRRVDVVLAEPLRLVRSDRRVRATPAPGGGTRLSVDVHQQYGRSVTATLRPR
ncbi:silent information regulator protein Sir2 [Auraticoccus sp. F435]|uniref:Silent information regulator protein Sir2 n=1 Tax=Auraticoccus cholistanensis TaxID=2656650 RepID=A0A6A9UVU0_9ACTN|nr:polysaccharide lyase family 8 super-sandwich domain-containing protein [Auraticoccus cholistanensis]MVA76808.1 silent information regulator protein Sir2 [Auraticoccus cholistanensis]